MNDEERQEPERCIRNRPRSSHALYSKTSETGKVNERDDGIFGRLAPPVMGKDRTIRLRISLKGRIGLALRYWSDYEGEIVEWYAHPH